MPAQVDSTVSLGPGVPAPNRSVGAKPPFPVVPHPPVPV